MNTTAALPIILLLILIVGVLGRAMYHLAKDDGLHDRKQLVRALTLRISLSFMLFAMLIIGYLAGWIQPQSAIM